MTTLYKISCTVYGHNADVRAVAPSPFSPIGIISGSRDFTSRIWIRDSDGKGYHQTQCLEGHTNFVSCVATLAPSEEYPDGLVFTGSSDKIVRVFRPNASEPVLEMKGHTDTVCTLVVGNYNMIISGSWDMTARVWVLSKNGTTGNLEANGVMTLKGHKASVWAALILEQGVMATGSADKTIKLWKAGKCQKTLTGHDDCVRGMASLSACQFLSCANDATVRRWMTTGECIQVYYGHTSFVYSISVLPGETEFVTSGEDRSLRVWNLDRNDPVQNIALPAQSAWDVTVLNNGDLVTGLSDGTIRVFSRSIDRIGSEQDIAAYETELSATKITKAGNDLGDIDMANTPGLEALLVPGTKDGQVLVVRNEDKAEAHQWSSSEERWIKIGDVVGGKKEETRKVYEGKEYDFVFDVDIKEGSPPLKLPYNLKDDAWFAAQKFIDDNDLSQGFLEQITDFIITNTKEARGKNPQKQTTGTYADPFTGGGRYVPNDSESADGEGQDPFTGSGRYVPGGNDTAVVTNGDDPFTGEGRYVPGGTGEIHLGGGAAADPMINPNRYIPADEDESMDTSTNANLGIQIANEYFPKEGFITFGNANVDAIMGKLRTFSATCGSLSDDNLENLKSLATTNGGGDEQQLELLWRILSWPAENVFPALDILRLACLKQHETCKVLCSGSSGEDERPTQLLKMLCSSICAPGSAKHTTNNRLLSLRTLCNMFDSPDGAAFLTAGCKDIFAALSEGFSSGLTRDQSSASDSNSAPFHGNKNIQVAAATLLLNFAVLSASALTGGKSLSPTVRRLSSAIRSECVEVSIVHLVAGADCLDPEAIFRYLVGMGTLISGEEGGKYAREAKNLGASRVVDSAVSFHSSVPKISGCSKPLLAILNAVSN